MKTEVTDEMVARAMRVWRDEPVQAATPTMKRAIEAALSPPGVNGGVEEIPVSEAMRNAGDDKLNWFYDHPGRSCVDEIYRAMRRVEISETKAALDRIFAQEVESINMGGLTSAQLGSRGEDARPRALKDTYICENRRKGIRRGCTEISKIISAAHWSGEDNRRCKNGCVRRKDDQK